MQDVDKTIRNICDWINKELNEHSPLQELTILPEMTKALAELVSARAMLNHEA